MEGSFKHVLRIGMVDGRDLESQSFRRTVSRLQNRLFVELFHFRTLLERVSIESRDSLSPSF